MVVPKAALKLATGWLQCTFCGSRFAVGPLFFRCPNCLSEGIAAELEMRYTPRMLKVPNKRNAGVWGWKSHLPNIPQESRITLGEGATALLRVEETGDGPEVYLKNETTNPTWSWKDRPNAVSVSMAKHFGFERVIAISTGNHGNAMAAMAAAGGLKATVLCNAEAPALQLALMQAYGARVVRGGNAEAMVLDVIKRGDTFPCTTLSMQKAYSNPFGVEGTKTIAFEIWQDLGRVPDRVFVGVGSGDGIYGIWKGFRELQECGLAARVPKIIGCQTIGANSLVRAFKENAETVTRLNSIETVAASLAEFATGNQALRAIRESEGEAVEVTDNETFDSMRWMSRRGIALEPSSAVPLACLRKVRAAEGSQENSSEIWVTIGSGAAPKWPEDLLRGFTMPPIEPDEQTFLR
jgi:threonine synthase